MQPPHSTHSPAAARTDALLINTLAALALIPVFLARLFTANDSEQMQIALLAGIAALVLFGWSLILSLKARPRPLGLLLLHALEAASLLVALNRPVRTLFFAFLEVLHQGALYFLPPFAVIVGSALIASQLLARRIEKRSGNTPVDWQTRARLRLRLSLLAALPVLLLALPWILHLVCVCELNYSVRHGFAPREPGITEKIASLTPEWLMDTHDRFVMLTDTAASDDVHCALLRYGHLSEARLLSEVNMLGSSFSVALWALAERNPEAARRWSAQVGSNQVSRARRVQIAGGLLLARLGREEIPPLLSSPATTADFKQALLVGIRQLRRAEFRDDVAALLHAGELEAYLVVSALAALYEGSARQKLWTGLLSDPDPKVHLNAAALSLDEASPAVFLHALRSPHLAIRRTALWNTNPRLLQKFSEAHSCFAAAAAMFDSPDVVCRRGAANFFSRLTRRTYLYSPRQHWHFDPDGTVVVSNETPESDQEREAIRALRSAVTGWLKQSAPLRHAFK